MNLTIEQMRAVLTRAMNSQKKGGHIAGERIIAALLSSLDTNTPREAAHPDLTSVGKGESRGTCPPSSTAPGGAPLAPGTFTREQRDAAEAVIDAWNTHAVGDGHMFDPTCAAMAKHAHYFIRLPSESEIKEVIRRETGGEWGIGCAAIKILELIETRMRQGGAK